MGAELGAGKRAEGSVGKGVGLGEDGAASGFIKSGRTCEAGVGTILDAFPSFSLKEMPVPGSEAVPYTPRGPKFSVNGAPPMLALNPRLDKFSLTPGITLNE